MFCALIASTVIINAVIISAVVAAPAIECGTAIGTRATLERQRRSRVRFAGFDRVGSERLDCVLCHGCLRHERAGQE